jgi:hypothetical protein
LHTVEAAVSQNVPRNPRRTAMSMADLPIGPLDFATLEHTGNRLPAAQVDDLHNQLSTTTSPA